MVGKATGAAIGGPVVFHDPPAGLRNHAELARADVAFICVPTPFQRPMGYDIVPIVETLELLKPGAIAVIRSTVLPGTTEALQAQHPHLKLMFVPEFLTESRADQDAFEPARVITGYTTESKPHVKMVESLFPQSPFYARVVAREAEAIKVITNAFYALKVAFFNQAYDTCERLGVFWGMVHECMSHDPMIAAEHMTINHNGYRGFGGKCLPKDTEALLLASEAAGVPMTLLREALAYNRKLTDGVQR